MKNGFLIFFLASLLAGLILVGCKKEPVAFSFSYSMESVSNYKVTVSFSSDRSYKIEQFNYFMDNIAKKKAPKETEGILTDEEYGAIKDKIFRANLYDMDDTYGFNTDTRSDLGDIIYQIYLASDGKEKRISISNSKDMKFHAPFIELVDYINDFLNTHKNN